MSAAVLRGESGIFQKQNDRQLREQVVSKLRSSPYYEIRHICCEVHNGVPVLHGTVSSYYNKQIAQACALAAAEAKDGIRNEIEVVNFDFFIPANR